MKDDELFEVTPMHELKPCLQWVGLLLGRDLYIDVRNELERKRAEQVLLRAIKQLDKKEPPHAPPQP